MRSPRLFVLCAVLPVVAIAGCGGGSSPAGPLPSPTATPTPAPAPTPTPLAYSVIPPCALPQSEYGPETGCGDPPPDLQDDVNAAIDSVIEKRPDLFDLGDVSGGPKVLERDAYMTAVAAAIGELGLCARIEAEGEMAVKVSNTFSEQWVVLTSSSYVRRHFAGTCAPATF